jgi:hypothetical protein
VSRRQYYKLSETKSIDIETMGLIYRREEAEKEKEKEKDKNS